MNRREQISLYREYCTAMVGYCFLADRLGLRGSYCVHSLGDHMNNNNSLLRHLPWAVLAVVGACALGVVALRRGEAINALWIVVAAVALYLVAYRYYSLFIATKVMQLDPHRATPAISHRVPGR